MKRLRGFTLIELLVVIAIIAILAAILFPVFAKARENARKSTCQSNLKQLAMAYLQYAQDYDEMFPGFLTGPTSGVRVYWYDNVQPYLKNRNIYTCPSTRYYLAPNRYSTSQNTATDYYGYPTPQIKIPADKILLADTAGDNSAGNLGSRACLVYGAFDPAAAAGSWNSCRGHLWLAHNEMTNIAFCDGHVKTLKPDAVLYGDTTAGRNKYWIGANE